MSNQTDLSLQNGATTPVSKTFSSVNGFGGKNQPAVWMLKEGVAPMAWPRVEVSMVTNQNGTTRVSPKVIVPQVVNDPSFGPKLVCKAIFDASSGGFIIPNNATIDQINDLEAFVRTLYGTTQFKNWVKSQDAQV